MSRRRIEGAATGLFPAEADPTTDRVFLVGLALAGKTSGVTLQNLRLLLLASSRLKLVLLNISVRQKSPDNHSPYLNPLSALIVCPHTKRSNGMQEIKHARSLRIGRSSQPGNVYLVTSVVKKRLPIFSDIQIARRVVAEMERLHSSGFAHSMAWVVMPDHLHWLFELKSGSLPTLMQTLKGRSAFAVNKAHGTKTLTWQKGYHDHGVRAEEDLVEMARYIVNNPIRAGLVRQREDYPLWGCEWVLE